MSFGRTAQSVVAALVIAFVPAIAAAAEICGDDLHLSSPQDAALLTFAHRLDLADPEAFREVAIYVHAHGALPSCYLTKRAAENDGWRPGGDLWSVAAGDAIGGDRYTDREHRLPAQWRGRYIEADLDYAGGHRGAHRLIFVRGMGESWLIFVSLDHYRHFARFTPAAAQ
ncbi:MAG: ribonuclease [Alphaproteobacteria bacterium]|nr:ribonuclease [Alphaproteobacteria bacterium]MDE1968887.1 ribonuclease [Alphaproteobacteria bacterium]